MFGLDFEWSMTAIWLVLLIAFVIIELMTMGLTTVWFAGGSLVAAVVAAIGGPLALQIVVMVVVSLLLMYFTRPIAVKYFNKDRTLTNVEGMIGQQAIVIGVIDNIQGIGMVTVNGQEWSARSVDDTVIPVGSVVTIQAVSGVKLMVAPIERGEQ